VTNVIFLLNIQYPKLIVQFKRALVFVTLLSYTVLWWILHLWSCCLSMWHWFNKVLKAFYRNVGPYW